MDLACEMEEEIAFENASILPEKSIKSRSTMDQGFPDSVEIIIGYISLPNLVKIRPPIQ